MGGSASDLPPRSTVLFKPPTMWETYRWQIVGIVAVILLQAALIIGLLNEHRRRRRAEVQERQRMAELAHMNRHATVNELSAAIAHELNQPLGAILVREVSELLSAQASACKVVLNSILSHQALPVSGDPVQIQQVILNLIVNAMDATVSAGGPQRKVPLALH